LGYNRTETQGGQAGRARFVNCGYEYSQQVPHTNRELQRGNSLLAEVYPRAWGGDTSGIFFSPGRTRPHPFTGTGRLAFQQSPIPFEST